MSGSSEPRVAHEDDALELKELTRSLLAYARWQKTSGAAGLPRATEEIVRLRAPVIDVAESAPQVPAKGPALSVAQSLDSSVRHPAGQPLDSSVRHPAGQSLDSSVRRPAATQASALASVPASALASVPASASEEARSLRLNVLAAEVASCTRCTLHQHRTQTVFARGTGRSGLCFVGEGPGAEEDAQGLPFVGPAGQLLDRMIAAMGLERDDVYICNIVKCRPPENRKPEPEEVRACAPFLSEQLELLQPKVMVALGATAVEGLLGLTGGITRLRGSFRLYQGRIPVMPTFHPAYLLRKPAAKREVWADLQSVMQHMGLKGGSAR